MKRILYVILVVAGCLMIVFGLRLAKFFYEFPAIPDVLTVTFWRDTAAFILVAVVGLVLMVIGIVRLVKSARRIV